jgi:hypothetical protein
MYYQVESAVNFSLKLQILRLLAFYFNSKISVCKIIEAKQFWDANKKKEAQFSETE